MSSPSGPRNSWIRERERTLIDSPVFKIHERNCVSSEDSTRKYQFLVIESTDWCNILPVTEDGKVVFVKQFRVGVEHSTLEMPGGTVDREDTDPMQAALRELTEETGYAPLPHAKCVKLADFYPNPALQNNRCHAYMIGPVRKTGTQNLDSGEMIEVVEVPIEDIPTYILEGKIEHSIMLTGFLFAALQVPSTSKNLVEALREFQN